ncbi:MAG: flagellar biosynthesis anti-sigma factor FlgM [Desulfovibrionaceae bacterium]
MSDDYKLNITSPKQSVLKIEEYRLSQKKEQEEREKKTLFTKNTNAKDSDNVSFSPDSILYTKMMKEALDGENVTIERQERMDTIKQQIADGSYTIDTQKIAKNILEEERQFYF